MSNWETLVFNYIEEHPMCYKSEILYEFGGHQPVQQAITSLENKKRIRLFKSKKKNDPQFQIIKQPESIQL